MLTKRFRFTHRNVTVAGGLRFGVMFCLDEGLCECERFVICKRRHIKNKLMSKGKDTNFCYVRISLCYVSVIYYFETHFPKILIWPSYQPPLPFRLPAITRWVSEVRAGNFVLKINRPRGHLNVRVVWKWNRPTSPTTKPTTLSGKNTVGPIEFVKHVQHNSFLMHQWWSNFSQQIPSQNLQMSAKDHTVW